MTPVRSPRLATFAATLALLSLAACDKKDDAAVAPAATTLAPSTPAPTAKVVAFTIDPKGTTSIDMPGIKEHIKADTSAAQGTLEIDLTNLANSRGEVRIDLTTLTTHTFDDAEKNATQTKHARTWLEAVVDGNVNEANRWAVLAVRSIDGLSATDLSKLPATKSAHDDVRAITATVRGELLVHGHKVERAIPVEVTFHYPSGAAADATPTSVGVKSTQPLRVVLKEHEVTPRDPLGAALQWTTALVSKVAETADVGVDLSATPTAMPRAAR